jgi:hypothetical protein
MESRVTDGYVVLPTGNRTGSVKVYDIVTGKIITRDQFKKCPMPDSVIQHLNKQALAEGRKIDTAHMHVFDELLNSCRLSPSHAPTYFTPTLMQDDRPQFATPPNLPRYPCTGQVSSGMGASVRRGNATLPLLIPFYEKDVRTPHPLYLLRGSIPGHLASRTVVLPLGHLSAVGNLYGFPPRPTPHVLFEKGDKEG